MNKIFSTKLFKEALRQLKVPASLFLGIMLGLSVIMSIANVSSAVKYYEEHHYITTLNTMEALIFLPFIFAIIVPVFVFRLFGFLTKRNASDFYHAIPNTRTCIYVSYSAAILCVSTLFVILGTALPCIVYSIAGEYISFNTAYACFYGINIFTCVVLCLGILLLSSSLTGTIFTNVLFAICIMFAPRFIITIITESITERYNEILPYNANFGIFSNNMNNIWSHIYEIFLGYGDMEGLFVLSKAALYTLILGLIYFALGLIAFKKRNSEQAESSAQNPIAHNIIRCGIGFLFTTFIVIANYNSYGYEFIELALLIFAAVFGMIIFELITTKKVKRLLNVMVSIPVVALLGVILYFVMVFAGNRILSYEPDVDKINYIQYSPGSTMNDNYDYFNYTTSKVKFDDEKIIEFLSDVYTDQLKIYREYFNSDTSYYDYMYTVHANSSVISVRFNEGLTSRERNLYLTQTQMAELNDMIATNEDYLNAFRSLPDNLNIEWGGDIFNSAEIKKIIAEYEKDLQNMDPAMLMTTLSSFNSYDTAIVNMEASTVTNVGELYISLSVSPDTPNAFAATKQILANKAESDETLKTNKAICELAGNLEKYSNEYSYAYISFTVYDLKNNTTVADVNFSSDSYYDFSSENSFSTLAYGTFDEFTTTLESFITDAASPDSANYVIFINSFCNYCNEDYTENEFYEYDSVFFSNDADAIEYFKAEDAYKEYYGTEYEMYYSY